MRIKTRPNCATPVRLLPKEALPIAFAFLFGGCSIDVGTGDTRYGVISYVEDQKGQYVRRQLRIGGVPIYAHNSSTNLPSATK